MSSDGQVQSHDEDAEATLDSIDAVILFPSLGAPCIVERGDATYVEVIVALEKDAHVSPGSMAHYLQFRPFAAVYPAEGNEADGCDEVRASDVFVTQDAWVLKDMKDGLSTEKPSHVGTDSATISLDNPIFNLTTCRLHSFVCDKLGDDYPDVYRVLFKTSALPVGQLMEFQWLSSHHHDGFLTKLKENAASARGSHLDDQSYGGLHMRHPFMVVASADALPKKFCHLTDIHNSSAHNLFQLSGCSVLEGQGQYSWPVGTRFNNYNRNFSHIAETVDADAFCLTGDLVDYGRGLFFGPANAIKNPPASLAAEDLQTMMIQAGKSDDPATVLGQARSTLPQKVIWDQLGGDSNQDQYVYDGNMHYFINEKILPRYLGETPKPVYTSLGNHDFHPNPFTPWPTSSGKPEDDSPNAFTPSDYNLTRYEATLAYGPQSYEPYAGWTVVSVALGIDHGGSGLLSADEACMIYFFFVNPFVDYAVRFGTRSIMMVDFGREEVRPQGWLGSKLPLVAGIAAAVIGVGLIALGIGLAATGNPVAGGILIGVGAVLAVVGALAIAASARDGFFAGDFESLDDLPAANNALTDEQYAVVDRWSQLANIESKALFCHALILGRAQKNISIAKINDDSFGGNKLTDMKFGILSKKRDEIVQKVQSGAITVTMSGHSHFRSIYVVPESGVNVTAEMPGDNMNPRSRLCVVSPASGPIAEVNRNQDDPPESAGSGSFKTIDRQLRDPPGASVLELDGGAAIIRDVVATLPQNKPRRAAFDSWKKRIDKFFTPVWRRDNENWHPSVEDEEIRVQLSYLSDLAPGREMQMENAVVTSPQATLHWPYEIQSITFFAAGAAPLTMPVRLEMTTPEVSVNTAYNKEGYKAHQYVLTFTRDQFNAIRMLAGTTNRMTCALEYPVGTDGPTDPWIFDFTVATSTPTSSATQYDLMRNEDPEYDKRTADLHYDQPFTPAAAAGAVPAADPAAPTA